MLQKIPHCLKCSMIRVERILGRELYSNEGFDLRKVYFEEYQKEGNPKIKCEECSKKVHYLFINDAAIPIFEK